MGNIGRPSSGCSRCRKRRVKCDERKPGCLRCERISEQCPGYSQDAWVFRDENDTARRRALRLKRSKPETSSSSADSSDEHTICEPVHHDQRLGPNARQLSLDSPNDDSAEQCKALTKVHPTLQADLDMRSVCLFMETFTLDSSTEGNDPAFLDYLPQLYLNSAADSSVRKAVHAVSQSVFVNRYGAHDLLPQTFQSYGKALSAINKSLTRASETLTDDTLAAVTLLSLYELICRPPFQTKVGTGWLNHIEGIQQLLRMRGSSQFTSTVGRQLFRMNYGPVLVKYIMLYEAVPESFAALGPMLSTMESDEVAANILESNFFFDAAQIRSNLQNLVLRKTGNHETFATRLQDLIDTLQSMLKSNVFETQAAQDSHWKPRTQSDQGDGTTGRTWFVSRYVASYWLQYWGTQLSLQTTIINSLLAKPGASTIDILNEISSLRQRIEETADKILSSVDFAVGRIDNQGQPVKTFNADGHPPCISGISALHLFWPAGVVKHAAYTTTRQKEAASDALRRIGTDCLIAQALIHV